MGCGQAKTKRNESQDMFDFSNFKRNHTTKLNISTNLEIKKEYDINKNPIKKRRLQKKIQSQTNSQAEISVYQK